MNHARTLSLLLAVSGAGAASGCGLSQEGVRPPDDTFFYPASAITDATGKWLFVANSNADLRYNDGTLVMVNLVEAAADHDLGRLSPDNAMGWEDCPEADYVNTPRSRGADAHFCCWDRQDPNILDCDERHYIKPDPMVPAATVAIGSFAAGMALQTVSCGDLPGATACGCLNQYRHRLFVAVRGDTSLTWVDLENPDDPSGTSPSFHCSDGTVGPAGFAACDTRHRITQGAVMLAAARTDANPPLVPLPNEPYALAVDDYYGLLYVGHLTGDTGHPYTGGFSLFDIGPVGHSFPDPSFVAPFQSPFPANSVGAYGVSAMTVVPKVDDKGALLPPDIYASSRFVPMVSQLGATVTCTETQVPGQRFRDIAAFPSGSTFNTGLGGSETRGIEFVQGRPFVLQRVPPALVSFNGGTPASLVETCSNPTFLYQYVPKSTDPSVDASSRLLVNCYDVGEIDVFDTVAPHLIRSFSVGRGPAGLVMASGNDSAYGRPVAYVVGFGDNNVSVVDLELGSPTELHVIQRIGFPSTVPR